MKKIASIDIGLKRIGVALCLSLDIVTPQEAILRKNRDQAARDVDAFLNEYATEPQLFQQLSLIVVDIDHFKSVNDQYGHIAGDQVITMIADQLKHNVRASDLIVRYGGDEFLVVIESIEMKAAKAIAESIRSGILKQNIMTSVLSTETKQTIRLRLTAPTQQKNTVLPLSVPQSHLMPQE
mgnify:CR=1 FL=1